jgi:cytochrome c-type biogenesis protein CcmH
LLFWAIAAAMTGLALVFVLPRLLSRRVPPLGTSCVAANLAVYRGEREDLDRDLAAGRLTVGDHARACAELERRMLADIDEGHGTPTVLAPPSTAVVIAIALPALAFGAYAFFGDPDATLESTVVTSEAGTLTAAMARDDLIRRVARHPRDGRGWVLLARLDFEAGRYVDAASAYDSALAASPKVAGDPAVWCEYADALGMVQGGSLDGKPHELVMRALALDPVHPTALEMAGSAAFEAHDYAAAARYWRQLKTQLPEGTPAHRQLAAALARVERLALVADIPGDPRRRNE